ncbi:MAG: hypothetical protein HC796_08055 [Synechococcaceae cyanobacterium RL_1_2]|nr:hypothetical protein [Synechococcaceae cyanobacterium RL_1_2]
MEIYGRYDSQYLAKVLCFNTAYQGVYQFVNVDMSQDPTAMELSTLTLVGYPYFDPATNVLSNSYRFTAAGTCYESSSYHWDGYSLTLVSSAIEDVIEKGCEDLGVSIPHQDYLITADSIGPVKLGMSLNELKAILSTDYI